MVVLSRHCLKSPCRSDVFMVCGVSLHIHLHSSSTNWVVLLLVSALTFMVPFRIASAIVESAAQLRFRRLPVVKGVPAH